MGGITDLRGVVISCGDHRFPGSTADGQRSCLQAAMGSDAR